MTMMLSLIVTAVGRFCLLRLERALELLVRISFDF